MQIACRLARCSSDTNFNIRILTFSPINFNFLFSRDTRNIQFINNTITVWKIKRDKVTYTLFPQLQ